MRPSCGGHKRPGLFFLKKTWLVMSLSGGSSPLEMAVCMTWPEQSNEALQRTPCTPLSQDTSWESGSPSLESVVHLRTKSQKKAPLKKKQPVLRKFLRKNQKQLLLYSLHLFYLKLSLSVHLCYMTAFAYCRISICVGEKPHLPQQAIRQKLSGNLRPSNCSGFLAIKLNAV